eukprot:177133-Amphidinium_carterae.1
MDKTAGVVSTAAHHLWYASKTLQNQALESPGSLAVLLVETLCEKTLIGAATSILDKHRSMLSAFTLIYLLQKGHSHDSSYHISNCIIIRSSNIEIESKDAEEACRLKLSGPFQKACTSLQCRVPTGGGCAAL